MIIMFIGSESTKSKIVNNFKIVARFPDCDRRTDKPCNSVAALFYKKKLGFSEKQKPIGQAVKGIFCIRHNSFYTVSIFLSTFPYFIRHMQRTYDTFRRGKLRRGGRGYNIKKIEGRGREKRLVNLSAGRNTFPNSNHIPLN